MLVPDFTLLAQGTLARKLPATTILSGAAFSHREINLYGLISLMIEWLNIDIR